MPPDRTIRVARAAARRRFTHDLLARTGRGLAYGAIAAVVVIGVLKLLGRETHWAFVVPPLALGLAWGVGRALLGRWDAERGAGHLDRVLGLRDRLRSAIDLDADSGLFARIAVQDAERIAGDVDVRRAVPIRADSSWLLWPIVGAGAVAMALFVPALVWGTGGPTRADLEVARETAATEVSAIRDEAEELVRDEDPPAAADAIEAIDELERELLDGSRTPEEARTLAAESLDRAASEIEQQAREEQERADELRERLARSASERDDSPASELSQRLSEGDLAGARQAARELNEQRGTLSEDELDELRRDLDALADRLDEPASGAADQPDPREQLRDLGLSDEQIDALDPLDEQQVAETLEDAGVERETAERAAEDIAEQEQQRNAEERAREDAERLRDALRDAARDLDQPQPPPGDPTQPEQQEQPSQDRTPPQPGDEQTPEQGSPNEQQQDQQQTGERSPQEQQSSGASEEPEPNEQGERSPSDQSQPGAEPREQRGQQQPGQQPQSGTPEPGEEQKPGERPQPTEQPAPTDRPGEQQTPQPGGSDEQRQPQPGEGTQPQDSTPDERQSSPDTQSPNQPGDGAQPRPSPQPGVQESPQSQPGAGEPQPTQTPAPGSGQEPGRGLDGLEQELERMAGREDSARESLERAEELRERARELYERASPEEREQMERWAREMARESPPADQSPSEPPRDTTPADLRPNDAPGIPEQVIAEWYRDAEGEPGAARSRAIDERVRRAADSALDAVEGQSVPVRRRELVRKVFDRVKEDN